MSHMGLILQAWILKWNTVVGDEQLMCNLIEKSSFFLEATEILGLFVTAA